MQDFECFYKTIFYNICAMKLDYNITLAFSNCYRSILMVPYRTLLLVIQMIRVITL